MLHFLKPVEWLIDCFWGLAKNTEEIPNQNVYFCYPLFVTCEKLKDSVIQLFLQNVSVTTSKVNLNNDSSHKRDERMEIVIITVTCFEGPRLLKVTYYAKSTSSCLFYINMCPLFFINMCPLCVKRFWKFQEKRFSHFLSWSISIKTCLKMSWSDFGHFVMS